MGDAEYPDPVDLNDLWKKYQEYKRPIVAEYAAVVAPLQRARKQAIADVERDFNAKVQVVKSDLYQAQRRARETMNVLKKWRASSIDAADREYDNARRPAALRKQTAAKPVDDWYVRHRNRLFKEQTGKDY